MTMNDWLKQQRVIFLQFWSLGTWDQGLGGLVLSGGSGGESVSCFLSGCGGSRDPWWSLNCFYYKDSNHQIYCPPRIQNNFIPGSFTLLQLQELLSKSGHMHRYQGLRLGHIFLVGHHSTHCTCRSFGLEADSLSSIIFVALIPILLINGENNVRDATRVRLS